MNGKDSFNKLPKHMKMMLYILYKNGMWPENEKTSTRGRSLDDPIVINFAEEYVRMEYLVAQFLLHPKQYKFMMQSLLEKNDHYVDVLLYHMTEEDGTIHDVQLYFDITVGYNALRKGL